MKNINITTTMLAIIFSVGFGGCSELKLSSDTSVRLYQDKSLDSGMKLIREPELDNTNKVEIGDNMYQKSFLQRYDTFEVTLDKDIQDFEIVSSVDPASLNTSLPASINSIVNMITPGEVTYEAKNHKNISTGKINKLLFVWSKDNFKAACSETLKSRPEDDFYSYNACLIDNNNDNTFTYIKNYFDDTLYKLVTPIKYKAMRTKPIHTLESFRYTVLYQGKIGNQIKISFREFMDDTSRPAFTQDISYELDGNGETIVGFKGLRIKILKATNVDIVYTVIKDYR